MSRIDPRIKCHNVIKKVARFESYVPFIYSFFNIAFTRNDFIWSIIVGAYSYTIFMQPKKRCRAVERSENGGELVVNPIN